MNNIYLTHHGVQGQKWGVRRYQNEDGTLTESGKDRYGVSLDGSKSKNGQTQYIKDLKDHRDQEKKAGVKNSDLTKEELKDLREDGKKEVGKMIGKGLTIALITTGVIIAGKVAFEQIMKPLLMLALAPLTLFFGLISD